MLQVFEPVEKPIRKIRKSGSVRAGANGGLVKYGSPPGTSRLTEKTNLNLLYREKQAYSTQI